MNQSDHPSAAGEAPETASQASTADVHPDPTTSRRCCKIDHRQLLFAPMAILSVVFGTLKGLIMVGPLAVLFVLGSIILNFASVWMVFDYTYLAITHVKYIGRNLRIFLYIVAPILIILGFVVLPVLSLVAAIALCAFYPTYVTLHAERQSAYRYSLLTSGWVETARFSERLADGYTAFLTTYIAERTRREILARFTGEAYDIHPLDTIASILTFIIGGTINSIIMALLITVKYPAILGRALANHAISTSAWLKGGFVNILFYLGYWVAIPIVSPLCIPAAAGYGYYVAFLAALAVADAGRTKKREAAALAKAAAILASSSVTPATGTAAASVVVSIATASAANPASSTTTTTSTTAAATATATPPPSAAPSAADPSSAETPMGIFRGHLKYLHVQSTRYILNHDVPFLVLESRPLNIGWMLLGIIPFLLLLPINAITLLCVALMGLFPTLIRGVIKILEKVRTTKHGSKALNSSALYFFILFVPVLVPCGLMLGYLRAALLDPLGIFMAMHRSKSFLEGFRFMLGLNYIFEYRINEWCYAAASGKDSVHWASFLGCFREMARPYMHARVFDAGEEPRRMPESVVTKPTRYRPAGLRKPRMDAATGRLVDMSRAGYQISGVGVTPIVNGVVGPLMPDADPALPHDPAERYLALPSGTAIPSELFMPEARGGGGALPSRDW